MKEFLRKCKKYFVFAAFISCFINLLGLTFTFYMYTIYDVICTSFSKSSLYTITIMATYALLMLVLFLYIRHRLLSLLGSNLDKSLSSNVLKNMIQFASGPLKGVYNRGILDLKVIRDYFSNPGMFAIFDIPWSPFYLILIFWIHRGLGILSIVASLIILFIALLQEKLCQDLIISANKLNFKNSMFETRVLRNAEAIMSMSMAESVISRWKSRDREVLLKQIVASNRAGVIQAIFKGLQMLFPISIYGFGAYYVIKGEITPGFMILASILESQATRPLIQLMYSYKQTVSAWEAYNRLNGFLSSWEKNTAKKENNFKFPRPKGYLAVSNVYFAVPEKIILKNISFSLEKGEFLGIIGPTGAGKTTLGKIIAGIWRPFFGEVRLDGYNIFTWQKDNLNDYIGYLPQEVILFPGTIAENIAGFKEVKKERIEQLVEQLQLTFIKELPDSYDTVIDKENTKLLSGGQKQKIGFARAIYNSPPLLILDEPNSNLDEESEQLLISFLMELKKKRETTCIIISHTPKLISIVDKILVLRDGANVDFGFRDVILKRLLSPKKVVQKRQAANA